MFSQNDFEAVWGTFCCYDYGAHDSKAVQNIAADQMAHGEFYQQWKWDNNLNGVYLENQKHKIQSKTIFLR